MSIDKTFAQTFTELWPAMLTAIGEDANPSSTIRPSLGDSLDLPPPDEDQPILSAPSAVGPPLKRLGEGGMGVVDRVEQRSVGRWVARKTARDDAGQRVLRRLMQEAWVTGFLEHPNIVPIYDIAEDAEGRPQILMREISGDDWERLLRSPDRVRERFSATDLLDWHLRVFTSVCNAVAYAHDKSIIHRDLKPENVMIGPFGEVWVLDWGLAVAVTNEHSSWIPRANQERRLAGTPRYMAPEMVLGAGHRLSKQTDVYLLGAILYQILTGQPPHDGSDLQNLLSKIPDFQASWPADAPARLCAIAEQALSPKPEDRQPSVDVLRAEVQRWLDTRRAEELADEAQAQVDALTVLLEEDTDRQRLYARFSAARFGFRQALREWSEHPTAEQSLHSVITTMIRWELDHDNPEAADSLLTELPDEQQALLSVETATLHEAHARDARRVARMRVDLDESVGVRTRIFVSFIVACCWIAFPVYSLVADTQVTWTGLFSGSVFIVTLFTALAVWARDSMSKSQLNRATVFTIIAVPIAQTISDISVYHAGGTPLDAYDARVIVWTTISIMYTATVVWRLFPSSIGYVLAATSNALWPEWRFHAMLAANLLLIINFAAVWLPLWVKVVRRDGVLYGRFRTPGPPQK